ncbi:c-type cytochrome [Prochlorococcus marinus]|uniref:Cytochrome C n=1 Tax=Prochlorococcus marinus XMU1408 TaxID=2213228 RepID=A0A318R098_PROMR|nr:c-type cytochrome [Prochlorococcus marinus]MBW3041600.1 cytochrome C [Prochlorococcus marinus str. XMU1408]PYE02756.1 cytochrome C [Prochlorococcus marinus XMU1408]
MKKKLKAFFLISFCCTFFYLSLPNELNAFEADSGEALFKHNCSGCHINGGNIIRRSKNLKISSLKRNGIDNPEAIAKIARQGIGIMSGYEDELEENGDQIVANWILEQAQKAWVQE